MKAKENIFSDGAMPRNLLENHSFQQLLNSLDIGIFISDIFFNRLISFTNNLEKILGCNSLELKHTPEIWGQILRSQEGSKLDDLLIRALDRSDRINFDLKIEDGHGKIKKIWISLLYSNGSHDHEILGKIQDVTDLREKEIAIAKMESMESEISARIQQKLLLGVPRNPPDGVKIDANSIPSRKVDGDFYDFNRMHDNVLDFFIGDVMGKGLNAALLGAGAKNLFNKAIISLITAGDNRPVIE
ncbi:MAG: hypothetical protein PF447_01670 [Spirochaetaceae bacterium]|jgi:hypothetical protein|nr:hypothetical protein [Spirochaetaceae bacterium]